MGHRPLISLCMIVRDEEAFLPRCLEAARRVADEICIVDTGSSDRSIEIATGFGARVASVPWADDFAAARNASLAMAHGRWILVLDADEVIDPSSRPALERIARDDRIEAAHVRMLNIYGDGRELECLVPRFFRNRKAYRFENRIHEQVLPSIVRAASLHGARVADSGVRVVHHGYQASVIDAKEKNERNRRLFLLELRDHPDNLYVRYKFADHLRKFADRDAVIEQLRLALATAESLTVSETRTKPYLGEVAALYALELLDRDEAQAADAVCCRAREAFLTTPHLLYVSGHAALRAGRPAAAVEFFRLCMAKDGEVLETPGQVGITNTLSSAGLVSALVASGRTSEALNAVLLRLKVDRDDGLHWLRGGEILLGLGHAEEAEPWLERAVALLPDDPTPRRLAGETHLLRGNVERAYEIWHECRCDEGCNAGLALIHIAMGEPMAGPPDFRKPEIEEHFARLVRRLVAAKMTSILDRLRAGAEALRAADPAPAAIIERVLAGDLVTA